MTVAVGVLAVAAFCAVLHRFHVERHAREAIRRARAVLGVLRNAALDDAEKERQARKAALALFGLFLRISLAVVAAGGVLIAVTAAGEAIGLGEAEAVYGFLMNGWVILGFSALAVLWLARRR